MASACHGWVAGGPPSWSAPHRLVLCARDQPLESPVDLRAVHPDGHRLLLLLHALLASHACCARALPGEALIALWGHSAGVLVLSSHASNMQVFGARCYQCYVEASFSWIHMASHTSFGLSLYAGSKEAFRWAWSTVLHNSVLMFVGAYRSGNVSTGVWVDRRFRSMPVLRFDACTHEASCLRYYISTAQHFDLRRHRLIRQAVDLRRHRPVRQSVRRLYYRSATIRTLNVIVAAISHGPGAPNEDITHVCFYLSSG